MFTGIVEEVGRLRSLTVGGLSAELEVAAGLVTAGTAVGDSILTDGVCLTVTAVGDGSFRADAMPETVRRTTLGRLRPGGPVNLERAATPQTRLGGHLVTGHVDGVGAVVDVRREQIAVWLDIAAPPEVAALCVPRGSLAVAGVSLTVVAVDGSTVRVSLIPHTAAQTTLGAARRGDVLNLEADVVARYVAHFLRGDRTPRTTGRGADDLTWERLAQAGFD
ncbi:MAG: riboflavin synthase [Actinobacteria bacterium]|nr:riboflavin synthase [Actinomycetota bacterium]